LEGFRTYSSKLFRVVKSKTFSKVHNPNNGDIEKMVV